MVRIADRKLHELVPAAVRPLVRRLGHELERVREAARRAQLTALLLAGSAVEHVAGPTHLDVLPDQMVVVAMMRNAAAHLPTFLRHYLDLGVRHVVLLDNGSTDETMAIAGSAPAVTVYRTELPFSRYEIALKRWLTSHAGNGWVLVADADELFDYPYRDRLPLSRFLEYLNANEFDAVCAQNLEMVPNVPLRAFQGVDADDLRTTHRWYDLTDYRRTDEYWRGVNTLGAHDLWSHTGGVWETFFGYRGSKLTKQPLFRPSRALTVFPYDIHFVTGARIADVTGVFRHYKYTGRFVAHVAEELERKQHYHGAEIFGYYQRALERDPDITFVRATSREWDGAEALLASGFLIASDRYLDWVDTHARNGARASVTMSPA
jgi:hypothetical protein